MATAKNYSKDSNGKIIEFDTFKDDTKPIKIIVKKNGVAEDLTSYTNPKFSMWKSSDGSLIVNEATATKGAATGELYYGFAAGDVDEAGIFGGKFHITDASSDVISVPQDGLIKININSPTET